MAVAWHAVRRGEVNKRTVAIVIGCGPIGLSVICMLKAAGCAPWSPATTRPPGGSSPAPAAPTSSSTPRRVAVRLGRAARPAHGHPGGARTAVGAIEKLRRLPLAVARVAAAEKLGATTPKSPVIFECVGVPGVIERIIAALRCSRGSSSSGCASAPTTSPPRWRSTRRSICASSRLHAAGVPRHAADAGRGQGRRLAARSPDGRPRGVESAFGALGDPETHAKILIDPKSTATTP